MVSFRHFAGTNVCRFFKGKLDRFYVLGDSLCLVSTFELQHWNIIKCQIQNSKLADFRLLHNFLCYIPFFQSIFHSSSYILLLSSCVGTDLEDGVKMEDDDNTMAGFRMIGRGGRCLTSFDCKMM